MNLSRLLGARAAAGKPVAVALIGTGKFGTMFLAQARRTAGMHVAAVIDLAPERAHAALTATGHTPGARSVAAALAAGPGAVHVSDDADATIAADGIEVVVDATGNPAAGIRHALACFRHGRHVVMVNVEADALAGPLLAERAREAGVVYSLAWGDQPALICEMVDWARTAGFEVVAAGKGTKYLPGFHHVTPDEVWQHYGLTPEQAKAGGMNAQMFNSFLDGTKSAIEMTAVANATGLVPAPDGLSFPACGVHDLAHVMRPREIGGHLHHVGQVEVISSEERDGRHVAGDLRWGVYVVFRAETEYVARCFAEYGLITDKTGRYSALWKPYHLIGLELGISVASAALRGEPTGAADGFRADAVATAKRDLKPGETLDGEGGWTVYGRLMPAADSLRMGGLPIGLAHGVKLQNAVPMDRPVTWSDIEVGALSEAAAFRREMERRFAPATARAAA
ncbi:MAG: flagellar biosynthesis protein FlgA [Alphaproteobacteria bacterium]|nr:flagellar biosynthesis protein FlgA [Alphaproteobacteria bacterium]